MTSKVTLQPLPTLETVIEEMIENYMSEVGYGDFFDSYTTIAQSDLKEVGFTIYNKMMEMSDKAMKENGRCPECGGRLVRRGYKATKDSPGASWLECSDCHDEISEVS
jgi:formate dehydrogenase maturation protein FdhE